MLLKIDDLETKARAYSHRVIRGLEEKYGPLTPKERRELTHQFEIAYLNGARETYLEISQRTNIKVAA